MRPNLVSPAPPKIPLLFLPPPFSKPSFRANGWTLLPPPPLFSAQSRSEHITWRALVFVLLSQLSLLFARHFFVPHVLISPPPFSPAFIFDTVKASKDLICMCLSCPLKTKPNTLPPHPLAHQILYNTSTAPDTTPAPITVISSPVPRPFLLWGAVLSRFFFPYDLQNTQSPSELAMTPLLYARKTRFRSRNRSLIPPKMQSDPSISMTCSMIGAPFFPHLKDA